MEIITELYYEHAENIWKKFNLKIYYDLFFKNDTLLLPDIFENFGDNFLIYMNLILSILYFATIIMGSSIWNEKSRIGIIDRYWH